MAEKILTHRTLRWSAPSRFADPFELDHNSTLSFSSEELLEATVQSATAMIFAKEPPSGNAPVMNAIRRWRDEERFASPEEAHDVLGDLLAQVVTPRAAVIDKMMHDWQHYARSVRICSFCDKVDNPTAWRSFADNHQGVAIRFDCSENSSLKTPKKVLYQKNRPEISSLRDQVAAVLNSSNYRAQDHFEEQLTIKPYFYSAEREWRCFGQTGQLSAGGQQHELYDDVAINSKEISAVYLGAFMDKQLKKSLLSLLKEKHPKVKIYQASVVSGKFELEFTKL